MAANLKNGSIDCNLYRSSIDFEESLKIKKYYVQLLLVFVLTQVFFPGFAKAELGGTTASVFAEQSAFSSQLSVSTQGNITIYTQTLPSGVLIYEYASNNGGIFAVSWSGPTLPNLQAILGIHFKDYLAALKQSRGAIYSHSENLVIQSSGMMGAFQGFAYLPQKTPVEFSTKNLLP